MLIQPFFSCTTLFSHVVSFFARLYRGQEEEAKEKKNQKLPDAPPLDPTDENHFKGRKRRAELLQEDGKVARKELSREGKSFLAFFFFYFFSSSSFILCCTSKEVPEREKDSADQSRGCWYERVPLTFISLLPVPHFSITTQPTFLKSSNNDNNSTCFEILILISNLFCSLPYFVID